MTYPKLIIMDLEGTLLQKPINQNDGSIASSIWTLLAVCLGEEALREEQLTKERWLRGEYLNYIEWMQDTIRIHKQYGLTKDIFQKVIEGVDEMPGTTEVIRSFHDHGAVTAIVSGGFKARTDIVQKRHGIRHAITACEYFFHPQTGLIEYWNLLPSDYKGKAYFIRLLRSEYRIAKKDCVFIGDANNDIPVIKEVGFSIAFNAQADLRAICTHSIDQEQGKEDFTQVATCIENIHTRSQS